jgi:hypothetical protein
LKQLVWFKRSGHEPFVDESDKFNASMTDLARLVVASGDGLDFGQMIERMPEDAPPKWMFRNLTAIRENTDRILELLESDREAVSPDG